MCNWTLRLAKALMSLLYLGSSEFCGIPLDQYSLDVPSAAQMSGTLWLLLRPFLLTQAPMRGPFLWEDSGNPRATMVPSVASNVAWGGCGWCGLSWRKTRQQKQQTQQYFMMLFHTWKQYFTVTAEHVFACEPRILLSRAVGRSGAMVGAGWCQQPALRGCDSDARPSLQLRIFLICKLKRSNFSGQWKHTSGHAIWDLHGATAALQWL